MKGRRTPTAIKEAQGTRARSREVKNEMLPARINGIPRPPNGLHPIARKTWKVHIAELYNLKMLHTVDMPLFLSFCIETGKIADLEKTRNELVKQKRIVHGYFQRSSKTGELAIHPIIKTYNDALANVMKLSEKFGFNPSARMKISMPEQSKKESDFD